MDKFKTLVGIKSLVQDQFKLIWINRKIEHDVDPVIWQSIALSNMVLVRACEVILHNGQGATLLFINTVSKEEKS